MLRADFCHGSELTSVQCSVFFFFSFPKAVDLCMVSQELVGDAFPVLEQENCLLTQISASFACACLYIFLRHQISRLFINKNECSPKICVIIACFCLLCAFSRAGLRAHSRSSFRRHGNRCQAWPSMAPVSPSLLTLLWVLCWLMARASPVPTGGQRRSPSTRFRLPSSCTSVCFQ